MYIQEIFRESQLEALHRFIKDYSLATLVTASPSLDANVLPLEVVDAAPLGILKGHVARSNPFWRVTPPATNVLAMFHGPNSYISPRWYVNGQRSGRVAPSWNYTAVQAVGSIRFIESTEWLHEHLTSLTDNQERSRDNPWQVANAPTEFIADTLPHLVGFEIAIERIEGKRFLSQHRTVADRQSLVEHLRTEPRGISADLANEIAAIDK